jgi:hypothetical protein
MGSHYRNLLYRGISGFWEATTGDSRRDLSGSCCGVSKCNENFRKQYYQ